MKAEEIRTLAVVGAGTMGRQIAMQAALSGTFGAGSIYLCSRSEASNQKAKEWTESYLRGRVKKNRITEKQACRAWDGLVFADEMDGGAAQADLIIESIPEDFQAKWDCFTRISALAREDAILATNSSNILSTRLMGAVEHPERLLNLHFLNPALVMELVEVMGNEHTTEETIQAAKHFAERIGKRPIILRKEIPGFVANRINAAITHEACQLVEQGIATVEEIDLACEKGLNFPMGPFRLMDLVGIDIHYQIRRDRYEQSRDPFDAPSPVVIEKVKKGEFGRKTGRGWYSYPETKG